MTTSAFKVIPGAGSGWDRFAESLQSRILTATASGPGKKLIDALSGEKWLGHPAHPAIVAVPAGAFFVSAYYDARSASGNNLQAERAADTTLLIGLIAAVPAALTGVAQFLQTDGIARRVAAAHWALNAAAVTLYGTSALLRSQGLRTAGRRSAYAGLGLLGPGAYLGGHLAYRLGVGQVVPAAPQLLVDEAGRG